MTAPGREADQPPRGSERSEVRKATRAAGASGQHHRPSGPLGLAAAALALAAGLPGCIGLALGLAPQDWPVPFRPQVLGDFALRTVVYLSGLLASFGALELVVRLGAGARRGSAARQRPPDGGSRVAPIAPRASPVPEREGEGEMLGDSSGNRAEGLGDSRPGHESLPAGRPETTADDQPVPLAEPLYGFLPAHAQERLARATGYQPLLYTKISILFSAGVGILLAGSWEFAGPSEPIPSGAALRIGAGLYLVAECVHRYLRFARGAPSGTLIGLLLHGALAPLRRRPL